MTGWQLEQKIYNLILKVSHRLLQIGRKSKWNIIEMKKIILGLLLVTLITATGNSQACCSCSGCDCGSDPSFPVNQQVCISTPPVVKPPSCLTPDVPTPTVCAPCVDVPDIHPPTIEVCSQDTHDVIAPPTVHPPTVCVPQVHPPVLPPPPPPPQVPSVCDPVVLPPPPTIPVPPPPTFCDDKLTNVFHLTFSYACRKHTAFLSCQANIIWNNVIVASLNPSDYNIHTNTIEVVVLPGENRLQIEGAGYSDRKGLVIDNVKLKRDGTNINIIVNSGFEQPDVGHSWTIQNDIPGWDGKGIQIGWGSRYVKGGYHSQVAELDSRRNYQITQNFHFDSDNKLTQGHSCETSNFPGKFLVYKLQFDYAARKSGCTSPATSFGNVLWNNVVIASLTPGDYQVHHAVFYVELVAGNNVLQFDGASYSDGLGLTIDNVKLTSKYDSTNLIHNGGFENPAVNGNAKFPGGIYGWKAFKAEVGDCKSQYNDNWPACDGQCIELDVHANQRYTQIITISQFKFTKLYTHVRAVEGDAAVTQHICTMTGKAHQKINSAVAVLNGDIYCQIELTAHNFNDYLCDLYQTVGQEVKDVKADEMITLSQYDCLSDAYVGRFGKSYEVDFDDGFFNAKNLDHWEGYIEAIHGKIIRCRDKHGRRHYLQISPCSHFEGQFPLPVLNQKIYWKGAVSPCGKTYVKWATTCNC